MWRVLGDYHAAQQSLDRFISQEPDHVLALYNRGLAREMSGNFKGALGDYRLAALIRPRFAFIKLALARLESRAGDTSGAKKHLEEAARLDSGPASPLNVSQFKGRDRDERLVDMHFTRGQRYYSDGELDLAAAEYRKVLSLDPGNADAMSDIGVVYLQKGMVQRGVWQLRQVLKIAPSHSGAKQNLEAALKIMKLQGLAELPQTSTFTDVPIVMYHKVDVKAPTVWWVLASDFKTQMDFLKTLNFETVTLEDLFDAHLGKKKLPARPVVITFDGGFKDQVTQAVPVLKADGFTASFFLISSKIGSTGNPLNEPAQEPQAPFMTWKDARALVKSGFEPCVNSMTHISLVGASPDVLTKEIVKSRDVLRRKLGRQLSFFSYPFGSVDAEVGRAAKQAGYKGAVTASGGLEEMTGANMYLLRRIQVLGGDPSQGLIRFAMQVTPEVPLPDIAMTGPYAIDPLTQEPRTSFEPNEKMRLKFSLRNLGDDVPVALKIRVSAVNGKDVRVIFDEQYGTRRYPIEFQFETVRDVDMTVVLPADLAAGHLMFNFFVTSPDGKLAYFRVHDRLLADVK